MVIAVAAFLAAMAAASAQRHKKDAEKWKQKHLEERASDVAGSTAKANQHLSQAKLHEAKADEIDEKAAKQLDKVGSLGMSDILNNWSDDRLRKSDT